MQFYAIQITTARGTRNDEYFNSAALTTSFPYPPHSTVQAIPLFLAGSFAVLFGDHLRSWDHLRSNLGIICGRGSFAVPGSFAELYSS